MESDTTYRVIIDCPRTHREVDTGLVMSKAAFAHPAVWQSAIDCPSCGEHHEYDMGHARLKVDDERALRRSRHSYQKTLRSDKRRRRDQLH
jgi:hypothetical protein